MEYKTNFVFSTFRSMTTDCFRRAVEAAVMYVMMIRDFVVVDTAADATVIANHCFHTIDIFRYDAERLM